MHNDLSKGLITSNPWSHLRQIYPKLTEEEEEDILTCSLSHDTTTRLIRQYLVEEKRYRFGRGHLSIARHRKRLYEFVLNHLKPELNRDVLQSVIPFEPLTDAKLLAQIQFYFQGYVECINRISTQPECEIKIKLGDMAELLFDQHDFIPKIVYTIHFLESDSICSDCKQINFIEVVRIRAQMQEKSLVEVAREMAVCLRAVLNLMIARSEYYDSNDIDWDLESPVDLTLC